MDLRTTYLDLELKNPLVVGSSPLVDDFDTVRRLEDAGAAAIVMHSLFAEQIVHNRAGYEFHVERHEQSFAEATTYFPPLDEFALGPDQYLSYIQKLKVAVGIPIVASLNGSEPGEWFQYARMMEEAGADAIELNLYSLATDPEVSGPVLEEHLISVVRGIRARTHLPLAVKLSPFYTSIAHFARKLDEAGVDALVLFNRFYQPDIDIVNLEVEPTLTLSDPGELLLRLRWLAILFGRVEADLAVTGGVHSVEGVIKSIMVGARAVQVVSRVLREGPGVLARLLGELASWMEKNEYSSIDEMLGCMSHIRCGDTEGFERTNYMRVLNSWRAAS